MTGETFGQMLRRLRRVTTVTVSYPSGENLICKTGPMSQNELARRAGVDPALIHRMELSTRPSPRRETVDKLAEALELDDVDTARLLIAVGYWPWPEMPDGERDQIVRDVVDLETCEEAPFIRRRTG